MLGFGIVFIVAALVMMPIRFQALGYFGLVPDAFSCFSVRVGKHPVFSAILSVRRGELVLTDRKGRENPLKLSADKSEPNSLASHLDNGFLSIVDLRNAEIYVTAGVANNAFAGAMMTGALRAALGAGLSVVKTHYTGLSALDYVETDYETDILEFNLAAQAALSFAEFVYGFGAAVARKWKITRRKHHESVASVG